MQKTIFKDKYPVWRLELKKSEIKQTSVAEIISYFKDKIQNHAFAEYIILFDHYKHIEKIGGAIIPEVLDMQNIVFCFGPDILDTQIASVRPRSIGICQLEDRYIIEFMQPPSDKAHETMMEWTKALESKLKIS